VLSFKSKLHSFFPVDSDTLAADELLKEAKMLGMVTFSGEPITELKQLFKEFSLLEYYRSFLTCEHSEENLEFYLRVQNYKKLEIQLEINEEAINLYTTYLRSGAPRQVNIAHNTQQSLDILFHRLSDFETNVFDKACKEIYKLMESDSWKRFIKSDYFPRLHYRAQKKDFLNYENHEVVKNQEVVKPQEMAKSPSHELFPKFEKKPKTRVRKNWEYFLTFSGRILENSRQNCRS
jgi:hypothetical protein